jgi:flagellar hook-associated protein 3 FlgL
MFSTVNGSTQSYLANLDRIQQQMQNAEAQISSGLRVQTPSDDPSAVAEILQTLSQIAQNQQVQSNLGSVKTEVDTADASLQIGIKALESAISLASQGASSTSTASDRSNLADQVSGLMETIVGISRTTVNGRYIFSGDQDAQPAYELDSSQPTGVKQLVSAPATRLIQTADGTSFSVAKTAQQIFDARNPDGTVAAGNVFAALNALKTALLNNDPAGVAQASDSLHSADDYLNNQLAFYGDVQNRVGDAIDLAQKFQTEEQTSLSQLRDTNVPEVATQLTQAQVGEQASLAVRAAVSQAKTLFDYLA